MLTNSTDNQVSKRVVMIVQSLPPMPSGGAEIQALRLAAALKVAGTDVLFIAPGQGAIRGYGLVDGLPVYRLHSFLNYFLDLLFIIQKKAKAPKTIIEFADERHGNANISRKIGVGARLRYNIFLINAYAFLWKRRHQFDVLHSHTLEWPGYVAAVLSKWLNKKLIVKDSTMNGIFNILRYPAGHKKRSLLIQQAHFVAMTKVIRHNLLRAGVQPEKITDIPNGIKISGPLKNDHEVTGKVLFIGNLYQQPAKGIDILLRAWPAVMEKYPTASLLIAGDGDLQAYRNYINEKGIGHSVTLLGKHNDVAALMIASDVFVLPSRREGMPNVLMEAMLRAMPCIATDISGGQDLITNGVNGLLVQPLAITELAEGILYLLTHRQDAQSMGDLARRTITAHFDITDVARKYFSLYDEL